VSIDMIDRSTVACRLPGPIRGTRSSRRDALPNQFVSFHAMSRRNVRFLVCLLFVSKRQRLVALVNFPYSFGKIVDLDDVIDIVIDSAEVGKPIGLFTGAVVVALLVLEVPSSSPPRTTTPRTTPIIITRITRQQ
jgi:hypothetical protein